MATTTHTGPPEGAHYAALFGIDPDTVIDAYFEHVRESSWRTEIGQHYVAKEPNNPGDVEVSYRVVTTVTFEVIGENPEGRVEYAAGAQPRTFIERNAIGKWVPV